MKALIVEDDRDISQLLKIHLKDLGFEVIQAFDGVSALKHFRDNKINICILDLMLPELSGKEVCKEIRKIDTNIPILILSVKSDLIDKVSLFDVGADDYLTKPFEISELLARVKALLKRQKNSISKNILNFKNLELDKEKRTVRVRGESLSLTRKQFDLLFFLAQSPERVYNREELLNYVWGYESVGYEHTIDSHINRLRRKIEKDPQNPEIILTVWGMGYKFVAEKE